VKSKTYCVYVGCGKIYVTVDRDDENFQRICINRNSKDLKCPLTAIDSLNRSATFKAKREPRQVVKDELGSERHCCDTFDIAVKSRMKAKKLAAYSCSDAIARVLMREGVKLD
jgi:hypothetical protein